MTGRVKLFDLPRGIGFICTDEGGREAFIHYRDILAGAFKALYEGDIGAAVGSHQRVLWRCFNSYTDSARGASIIHVPCLLSALERYEYAIF